MQGEQGREGPLCALSFLASAVRLHAAIGKHALGCAHPPARRTSRTALHSHSMQCRQVCIPPTPTPTHPLT